MLRGKPDNDGNPWTEDQIETGRAAIPRLDAALKKSVVPENIIVWRGAAMEDIVEDWGAVVGKRLPDSAFMSTSLLQSSAKTFAGYAEEMGKTPLLVEVRVRRGLHGGYIRHATGLENREEEMLFPRDGALVVQGAQVDDDGTHRLVVELLYERRAGKR